TLLEMNIGQRGDLYVAFTQAGFWVSFATLILLGWKKKFPLLPLVAIVLLGRIGFLLGSQWGSVEAEGWQAWLQAGSWPQSSARSLWGGFILALLGIELGRRLLAFKHPIYRLYVIAVPLGLAVQRVGCFVAGCCFGSPTHMVFGLHYGQGTPVHFHHWEEGLIDPFAEASLGVYPIPLLFMGWYGLAALLMWRLRPNFKSQFGQLAFGLGLLATGRWMMEFLRDPASNPGLQGDWLAGLKVIQWVVLIFAVLAWGMAFLVEKYGAADSEVPSADATPIRLGMLLALSLGLVLTFRPYFTPLEGWAIVAVLGTGALIWLLSYFQRIPHGYHRWATVVFMVAGPFFMAQVAPEKPHLAERLAEKDSLPSMSGLVELGGAFGRYSTESRDCDGAVNRRTNYQYQSTGLAYHHQFNLRRFQRAEVSLLAGLGRYDIEGSRRETTFQGGQASTRWVPFSSTTAVRSLGLRGRYDFRWVGVGGGYYFGPLVSEFGSADVYGRIGPYDIFYAEGGLLNMFPISLVGQDFYLGLGTGLGHADGRYLRTGFYGNGAWYLGGRGFIKQKFMLGGDIFIYGNGFGIQLNVGYRIP
ncbi:MAG: prolipoprotein diacylglyceryl transferase family protein, partial [Bacteroidota bacterium]